MSRRRVQFAMLRKAAKAGAPLAEATAEGWPFFVANGMKSMRTGLDALQPGAAA